MRRVIQLAIIGTVLIGSASADIIILNFEGLQNNEGVLSYYNGGLGSLGSGPGPSDGVTFTSNGNAYISDQDGGTGGFAGNPSGDTAFAFVNDGNPAIMDVAAGFTTGFSFYYSAINSTGPIDIYSGLDDTGTLLATFTPPTTPSGHGSNPACVNDSFCPFFAYGVSFSGTAMSVDFTGTENVVAFDDINLGSATPDVAPEPAAFGLVGLGLASLLLISRRQRKLQRDTIHTEC